MGSGTRTNRFVYVAAAIAALNGALFGYDTGIISREVLGHIDDSVDHDERIQSIRQAISQEGGEASELLKRWLRPALIVGIGLAVLQQITGVNTVIYYALAIFHAIPGP